LAVLSYQLDGKPAAAVSALEALVRARSRYDDRQVGEVLVHLAAAQRAEGDVDAADASAQEALKIRADDPAAHLQAFLIELDRGAAPAAAKHWPFLVGRLDDAALEKVLEGRLRVAEGRFPDAAEAFEKSYGQDPRRLDAAILAGVAAARASARTEAFKDLFAAAHLDPTRSEPRPAVTRFYLQPGESLRGTEGYVIKLASGGDETVAKLDEALILYHHHQLDRADKLLNEVLALDDNNALAHALKSLVVLDRGDRPAARAQAALAVRGDRELALAHYAQARASLAGGDVDGALRALRETVARAPSFGAGALALAQIEIQRKDLKAARERLMHLVAVDPSYVAAKRALYVLEAPAP
jgi:predicted Zn-dependent protease